MKKDEEKPRTTLERQWKLWSQGRMLVIEISLGGLGCLYVELGEARGPEAPWWLTLLRPASYLDSKVNVGMSPRLDTRRGWLLD